MVHEVATTYVETKGKGEGKRTARKVGGGAGLGAIVGGIAGGGEGAAIGAAVGGVTGAAVASGGEEHLTLPAETRLSFNSPPRSTFDPAAPSRPRLSSATSRTVLRVRRSCARRGIPRHRTSGIPEHPSIRAGKQLDLRRVGSSSLGTSWVYGNFSVRRRHGMASAVIRMQFSARRCLVRRHFPVRGSPGHGYGFSPRD